MAYFGYALPWLPALACHMQAKLGPYAGRTLGLYWLAAKVANRYNTGAP